jgi:hypothetical protein
MLMKTNKIIAREELQCRERAPIFISSIEGYRVAKPRRTLHAAAQPKTSRTREREARVGAPVSG